MGASQLRRFPSLTQPEFEAEQFTIRRRSPTPEQRLALSLEADAEGSGSGSGSGSVVGLPAGYDSWQQVVKEEARVLLTRQPFLLDLCPGGGTTGCY